MLTVKVRESRNDQEVVFEASQVNKSLNPNRKEGDQFIGEVRCDCVTSEGIETITYPIRAVASDNDSHVMYVMNRNGATVAVYYL